MRKKEKEDYIFKKEHRLLQCGKSRETEIKSREERKKGKREKRDTYLRKNKGRKSKLS